MYGARRHPALEDNRKIWFRLKSQKIVAFCKDIFIYIYTMGLAERKDKRRSSMT